MAEINQMTGQLAQMRETVQGKAKRIDSKMKDMEAQKVMTFEQIDRFFEEVISKAKKRAEALKVEFMQIQREERIRLK